MVKDNNTEKKERFQDRLASFISSKRTMLLVFLCLIVGGLVVLTVFSEIDTQINEEATLLIEKAQANYQEWLIEEDLNKKNIFENEIIESLDHIISNYSYNYPVLRALYTKGLIYFNNENWQTAHENFILIKDNFSQSYLTALALYFEGVCQEELNNPDLAIEAYLSIYKNYKTMPLLPAIIFSIGRLYDETEDYVKAEEFYNILKADYQNSTWTNHAINRIINLKSEGKL